MLIRAYLNIGYSEESLADLKERFSIFAQAKGQTVNQFYIEQKPPSAYRSNLLRLLRDKGLAIATQGRLSVRAQPESFQVLFKLLKQARPNDVLLIESVRMLASFPENDWFHFRQKVREKKVRLVPLDVEASWPMLSGENIMAPVAAQLTNMMLELVGALDHPQKDISRSRQLEGIARAKRQGKYQGRPVDLAKHKRIQTLLDEGYSWSEVCRETGVSRSTIARVVKAAR